MNNSSKQSEPHPRLAPLSFLVALWIAIVIALAMGVYGVWQYFSNPGITVRELARHHLWHVVVLGGVIHLSLWACLHCLLIRPLNQIYLHLYNLGGGRVQKLNINTSVAEVQTIMDGINLMIWRLDQWMDIDSLRNMFKQTEEISALAAKLDGNADIADAVSENALALKKELQTIIDDRDIANQVFHTENSQPVPPTFS